MAAAPLVFDLRELSVSYGDVLALDRLSLRIRRGEKAAVIGPSGAGKTTLLEALCQRAGPRAAPIHQDYALVPPLSAFHNVCIGRLDQRGALYNLLNLLRPRPRELARVAPLLGRLGLGDKLLTPARALSGGQQQRVAIARALYRGGEVILGDEPVSALDPHQAREVLRLLRDGAPTVVVSLHDVELALALFERIIGLRAGRLLFDLPSDQVDARRLAALYRPC